MKICHDISIAELRAGDHCYVYRKGIAYMHHGIAVEFGEVEDQCSEECFKQINTNRKNGAHGTTLDAAHRRPDIVKGTLRRDTLVFIEQNLGGLQIATLKEFLNGGALRRVEYGRSPLEQSIKRGGTCYSHVAPAASEITAHAIQILMIGKWEYNVWNQNCENLAMICTGVTSRGAGLSRMASHLFENVLQLIKTSISSAIDALLLSASKAAPLLLVEVEKTAVSFAKGQVKHIRRLFQIPKGTLVLSVAAMVVELVYVFWHFYQSSPQSVSDLLQNILAVIAGNSAAIAIGILVTAMGLSLPAAGVALLSIVSVLFAQAFARLAAVGLSHLISKLPAILESMKPVLLERLKTLKAD